MDGHGEHVRLRHLQVAEPDGVHREWIRARCHTAILQRIERRERRTRRRRRVAHVLESAVVGGLCASYLLAIVFVLLELHGG